MTAAFVSAVETDPSDVPLLREAAYHVCRYINEHSLDIPIARRGIYLASLRSRMVNYAAQLDATGLSRLAWLFILEGDTTNGETYAEMGLSKDPRNDYCRRILEKRDARIGTSKPYRSSHRGR